MLVYAHNYYAISIFIMRILVSTSFSFLNAAIEQRLGLISKKISFIYSIQSVNKFIMLLACRSKWNSCIFCSLVTFMLYMGVCVCVLFTCKNLNCKWLFVVFFLLFGHNKSLRLNIKDHAKPKSKTFYVLHFRFSLIFIRMEKILSMQSEGFMLQQQQHQHGTHSFTAIFNSIFVLYTFFSFSLFLPFLELQCSYVSCRLVYAFVAHCFMLLFPSYAF